MKKLEMKTPDIVAQNLEKLASIFPHCITEDKDDDGNIIKSVNWDALVQEFANCPMSFGNEERYQFTWPDKRLAVVNANTPTTCTLRPVQADSLNFETTKNLYIEGDNLEVLKCLRETYLGKVKMIYIDPPYNTGNDFVYNDDFVQCTAEYLEHSGQLDTEGNRLVQNIDTNGRFHTDWLNMMYPRLKVARDLLSDDGVIFISIDDNEAHNLRKICDEIFGEENFVGNIIWQSRTSISNDDEISTNHNHTYVYSKNRPNLDFSGDEIDKSEYINLDNDERGPWKLVPIDANHIGGNTYYPVMNPQTGVEYYPPNGRVWCYNPQIMQQLIDDGRIKFGLNDDSSPKRKLYYNERIANGDSKTPSSILLDAGTTKTGTTEIMNLFDNDKVFDYPKPTTFISRLIKYGNVKDNDIVLDFFSGSATTANSLMLFCSKFNISAKYIMVQIAENFDETIKTANHNAKKTIKTAIEKLDSINKPHLLTEIAKERIRRSGKKILDDLQAEIDKANAELAKLNEKAQQTTLDLGEPANDKLAELQNKIADLTARKEGLDVGFRVLRLDTSNMEDVFYRPADMENDTDLFTKAMREGKLDSIKSDRTELDLLFQIMLELGILLSSPIEPININGKRAYSVNENFLIACFDKDINDDTILQFAKLKPQFFVMRDSSASDDSVMTNFDQIFKQKSPQTQIRIL